MNELPRTADIVIVGGGVIGLAIARELALRGIRNILVLERGELGSESSFAAAGMLAPQAEADGADVFFRLACRSRDSYAAFADALRDETGIDIELEKTGTLYLALTDDDVGEIDNRYEWQGKAGLAIEKLTAVEAEKLEPSITKSVRSALRFPNDIQVENRQLVKALAASNKTLGIRTVTGTAVESVNTKPNQISGVNTSRGFVSTSRLVIACGAWSSSLQFIGHSSSSNITDKACCNVRIEPVRGQMLSFETGPALARHVIYSPRGYIVPRKHGRLLAGSTSEHVGFDKRVTEEGREAILAAATEIAPAVKSLVVKDSWAGLRPRASDNLPVLGPCAEIEGVFYATGHYRNGILLAPVTGELIARAIIENEAIPNEFSPNRFSLAEVS